MFRKPRALLILAVTLAIAFGVLALPALANKAPIRIINLHSKAEVMVGAYNVDDWFMGAACQRLNFSTTRERSIQPWTAEGLDKLFNDHCGNYDKLKLVFTSREPGYNSDTGKGYKHFDSVIVPWGAVVTLHGDLTLRCTGCDWTTKSK